MKIPIFTLKTFKPQNNYLILTCPLSTRIYLHPSLSNTQFFNDFATLAIFIMDTPIILASKLGDLKKFPKLTPHANLNSPIYLCPNYANTQYSPITKHIWISIPPIPLEQLWIHPTLFQWLVIRDVSTGGTIMHIFTSLLLVLVHVHFKGFIRFMDNTKRMVLQEPSDKKLENGAIQVE